MTSWSVVRIEEMDNPYIRTLPAMTDDDTVPLLAALNRFQVFSCSSFEMGILAEVGADVMDNYVTVMPIACR